MKLTTGILTVAVAMTTGLAFGQNPDAIDNARSMAKSLQQIQTTKTNAALDAAGVPAQQADKSAAASPAPVAPKPATAKAAKPHDAFLPKTTAIAAAKVAATKPVDASNKTADAAKPPKPEEKKWAMNGKRDPFFSPITQQTTTSGCSTGKKCLEIGQINVRGVVKSDSGFIAVVTNTLNKAYFLHENDPVFNGYVVRITGDSVVFQETVQDKLGKSLTREVTKKILTPAV
jgi:Tfp pilus assembly protein PilP